MIRCLANNKKDKTIMHNLRFILWLSWGLVSLMLWLQWQDDYSDEAKPSPHQESAQVAADLPNLPPDNAIPTTMADSNGYDTLPAFTNMSQSQDFISVETDLYKININKKGGGIDNLKLLKYPVSLQKVDQPIVMFDDQPEKLHILQGGLLSKNKSPTHESNYSAEQKNYTLEDDSLSVPLWWESDNGLQVKKTYRFNRDSYLINIQYQIKNYTDNVWTGHAYSQLKRKKQGRASKLIYTYNGAAISSPEQRYQKISFGDMRDEALKTDITGGWAAMLQHYFVSALIPVADNQPYHYYTMTPENERYIIGQVSPKIVVAPDTTATFQQQVYIGPKIQARLKAIAEGLELTVDYGVLWFLASPLFWVMEKIYGITGNWGWTIVLITAVLKLLFFNLSAMGYRSMANMRRVQPRLVAIRDRHKGDRMRLNQAMMDLYKEEKINPLGGCFPILVQIPVFIALYWVLLESVELRQSEFIFWLKDLSIPDPFYILPLIMGATMLVQQKLNPIPIDPIQQKVMSLLPIVFTVFFAFFPAGLVLYWVVNNILSILQQWVITKNIERAAKSSNRS